VSTATDAIAEMNEDETPFNIDTAFRAHYARVARLIARVVRDHARAEELAVEVFLKLWRTQTAQINSIEAWLDRVALRVSLDELRGRGHRARYEKLFGWFHGNSAPRTPEQIHRTTEEQEKVRLVLGRIAPRHAKILLLRSHGFSYEEIAAVLAVNPASIGTLQSRAQQAFRKEYTKRYGQE
jgi:RNA polymerase sigma-70 factor (ECF subfamily)